MTPSEAAEFVKKSKSRWAHPVRFGSHGAGDYCVGGAAMCALAELVDPGVNIPYLRELHPERYSFPQYRDLCASFKSTNPAISACAALCYSSGVINHNDHGRFNAAWWYVEQALCDKGGPIRVWNPSDEFQASQIVRTKDSQAVE